jgi:hypothetical protein
MSNKSRECSRGGVSLVIDQIFGVTVNGVSKIIIDCSIELMSKVKGWYDQE